MDKMPEGLEAFFERHNKIWHQMGQLQNEVGKLIIIISDVDSKLNMLFVLLCKPLAENLAIKILDDQQSLEKKIRLVNLLIEMQGTEDEKNEWASAHTTINESRTMRNIVAHQSAWIDDHDPSGLINVFLGPHPIAPKHTKEATAKEIGLVTNKLIRARHKITEIIKSVGIRKGLWEANLGNDL